MAQINLSVEEASERNDEIVEILDKALLDPVITHHGKYWNIDGLRIAPRPLQNPPPRWTTVVSVESARKAARRGSKLCTGFHPIDRIEAIFDAYREEAQKHGHPIGLDQLAIRRNVIVAADESEAVETARTAVQLYKQALTHDPRFSESPVPDAPGLARRLRPFPFHDGPHARSRGPAGGIELYGREVIPRLRRAEVA